jgi:hypothetical protein
MPPDNDYVRELFELREQVARLEEQLQAAKDLDLVHREDAKEALRLAHAQLEAWKTGSNEWRGALDDSRRNSISEDKVRSLIAIESADRGALASRVYIIEQWKDGEGGRRGAYGDIWAKALGIVALLIALSRFFVK